MTAAIVLTFTAATVLVWWTLRERNRRAKEARSLATVLVPEIRSILTSCDPAGPSSGTPLPGDQFKSVRHRVSRVMTAEALFAVETFYQCVDAYAAASREMTGAFASEVELSLGDRIRAKDRRDRCLKDVYYTGEGALERLQEI